MPQKAPAASIQTSATEEPRPVNICMDSSIKPIKKAAIKAVREYLRYLILNNAVNSSPRTKNSKKCAIFLIKKLLTFPLPTKSSRNGVMNFLTRLLAFADCSFERIEFPTIKAIVNMMIIISTFFFMSGGIITHTSNRVKTYKRENIMFAGKMRKKALFARK